MIKLTPRTGLAIAGLAAASFGVWHFNSPDRERGTNDPGVTFKLRSIDLPKRGKADTVGGVIENPDTASSLEFHFKNSGNYIVDVDVMYSKQVNWFSDAKWPGGSQIILGNIHAGEIRTVNVAGEFRGINITKAPDGVKDVEKWYFEKYFVNAMPSR